MNEQSMNEQNLKPQSLSERSQNLLATDLKGFTYYAGLDVFSELKIGTELQLVGDPENRYDANAVALYYGNKKLGFLPRSDNRAVSKLIHFGHSDILEARINRVTPDAAPEHQVGIVVRLKDRRKY